ncbi:MAG: TetR/AcrR family transcriptional regulator [Beijerinckiaceae bacterium]
MRYDADHKERTRQRLLVEAAEALRSEGPERVGVAALMSKLGLTHGGFYAHFKSKDELVAQAIEEMFEQMVSGLKKRAQGVPPAEVIERYIDFYLSVKHQEDSGRGCALPAMAADVSRMGRSARKRFAAGTERLYRTVAELFRELGRDDEEAMTCATSLLSEMAGAIAIARAVDSPKLAEQIRDRSRAAIKQRFGLTPAEFPPGSPTRTGVSASVSRAAPHTSTRR